jgi:UDP-glucose 4-epimerase
MMRCVVTGATGFVGRALVSELRAAGSFVRGLARREAASDAQELVAVDLATLPPDTTALMDTDVVFHLAAKTHDMTDARGVEAEYERTNVEGTRRLVEAARGSGVRRVVFVSSVKVIDEGNTRPVTEETPERPLTPYGRSKLAAERLVRAAADAGAFEAVCLRFPLVYGPGQRGNLQRMIDAVERGRFPPPPANGNQRSMLHVANAVQALLLAGTQPAAAGRTYIVSDERAYSTREIFEGVCAALGRSPSALAVPEWAFRLLATGGDLARRVAGRRLGFDSDAFQKLLGSAVYDCRLIRDELGYHPGHDLLRSLPLLVEDTRTAS